MELELLTLNAFGSVRPATRDGRPFLVANGTIIVPGVLPGSKGPLYYPEDEVRNSAPLWNGVDIVLRHPTDPRTGAALSAKSPGVLARVGMGLLQNTTFKGGRLGTELWFDVRNTERLDATLATDLRVLPKLKRGQPVELSTGLYTKQRPAPLGAVWNGRSYSAVAVAYRPDHLAVLPDEVGACSIRDGCGVLVNSRGKTMADVKPLQYLPTTNAFCPTGKGGGQDNSCGSGGGNTKGAYYAGRVTGEMVKSHMFTKSKSGKVTGIKMLDASGNVIAHETGKERDILDLGRHLRTTFKSAEWSTPTTNRLRPLVLPPRKLPDLFGVMNAFCPTGEGGGQDNSCSSSGGNPTVGMHESRHLAGVESVLGAQFNKDTSKTIAGRTSVIKTVSGPKSKEIAAALRAHLTGQGFSSHVGKNKNSTVHGHADGTIIHVEYGKNAMMSRVTVEHITKSRTKPTTNQLERIVLPPRKLPDLFGALT